MICRFQNSYFAKQTLSIDKTFQRSVNLLDGHEGVVNDVARFPTHSTLSSTSLVYQTIPDDPSPIGETLSRLNGVEETNSRGIACDGKCWECGGGAEGFKNIIVTAVAIPLYFSVTIASIFSQTIRCR